MKIMLVDHSKTMRNIQRGILLQMGYEQIEEASDGLDALAKIDDFNPQLILVDWNMPNMDGLSFIRQYRAAGGEQPVIIVTTDDHQDLVFQAIKAGATNYVVKPFTPAALEARVKEALARIAA